MIKYEYGDPGSSNVLVQMVDDHDLAVIESEVKEIRELAGSDFYLIALKVNDWNKDLSPWPAPPVFGDEPFGEGAAETLANVLEETRDRDKKYYIGGYSLAGLFALWAVYRTDVFSGAAAASPSVWFPGWIEYAEKHWQSAQEGTGQSDSLKSGPQRIYLSLGDKEERTRNQQMARVGDCIRRQHEILTAAGVANTLVWEQGNHFKEPDLRTSRAFAWVMGGMR